MAAQPKFRLTFLISFFIMSDFFSKSFFSSVSIPNRKFHSLSAHDNEVEKNVVGIEWKNKAKKSSRRKGAPIVYTMITHSKKPKKLKLLIKTNAIYLNLWCLALNLCFWRIWLTRPANWYFERSSAKHYAVQCFNKTRISKTRGLVFFIARMWW